MSRNARPFPSKADYSDSTGSSTHSSPNHSDTRASPKATPPLSPCTNIPVSVHKPQKTIPSKHKTQLCKTYSELGHCRYGEKCRFAHGSAELKVVPVSNQNYRKRKCKGFWENGECKYGIRCQFDHQKMDWADRVMLSLGDLLLTSVVNEEPTDPTTPTTFCRNSEEKTDILGDSTNKTLVGQKRGSRLLKILSSVDKSIVCE